MCALRFGVPLVIAGFCIRGANIASADVTDIGTSNGQWVVTGAGAVDAPALQNGYAIGMTSNGFYDGTWAQGGSFANFNGFWYADDFFTLPSNATNVSLSFSGFLADDRAVLQLNGVNIGNIFLNANSGQGVMSFPPGPPDAPFNFTFVTSGIDTTDFIPGQNDLRLVVNNTGQASLNAPTQTFQSASDGSLVGLNGSVTYSVPEPASIGLLAIGVVGLLGRRYRGRTI